MFLERVPSLCAYHDFAFRAATSESVIWRCKKCRHLRQENDELLPERQNIGCS
jgi:hypothetical protein